MGVVAWKVGQLHVSASNREVIREIRAMVQGPDRTSFEKKGARKELYREALKEHHDNQRLYHSVMTGRIQSGGDS
jgi:hypothetical protein